MAVKQLRKNGREYVIVPRAEYDRLVRRAEDSDVPLLPKPDAGGNFPAMEFLRASIARDIVRDRLAVGLTQKELARRAGIPAETLCRIETGKHSPSVPTLTKIDRAIEAAQKRVRKGR